MSIRTYILSVTLFSLANVGIGAHSVLAQNKTDTISIKTGCLDYNGRTSEVSLSKSLFDSNTDSISFISTDEAKRSLNKLLSYAGINNSTVKIQPGPVPNAAAIIYGGTRYIVYDDAFMKRISAVKTDNTLDWAALSVLAHELGHHFQGHTLSANGSNPAIEIQADYYSGFLLQKMHATLDQAQAVMKEFGTDSGTLTHPARKERLEAIKSGWTDAQNLAEGDVSLANGIDPNRYYFVQSKVSGLNLDVLGASRAVGNRIVQAVPNPDQVWIFIPAGDGYYYIQSKISGLNLDVSSGSKAIGNRIVQAVRDPQQVWKLIPAGDGYYYIKSKISGLNLDVSGAQKEVGTQIVQAVQDPNQVWRLIPATR